ncbi:unnamed protein product [Vitrella brassicaformis CCMP3155]|uniref:Potassium channel tetramerisation-type BTB domain-containing protein n=1 Tax=Vitrella brassicaformis (strain CCMP3155) TaxID=1169540 RepID=A0A0G4GCS7_VITBC|nr:unnamed protein product [Vitrella brassicaformis CCMP3155]|eukprot:CEM27078.1 unnamed protein product [Vitrella brassicaformis CCMP3155]
MALSKTVGDVVEFDVAGTPFKVARSTILRYPTTVLATLVGRVSEAPQAEKGSSIFIDSNPELFPLILDYYRHATPVVVPSGLSKRQVKREFDYFAIELGDNDMLVETESVAALQSTVRGILQSMDHDAEDALLEFVAKKMTREIVGRAGACTRSSFHVDIKGEYMDKAFTAKCHEELDRVLANYHRGKTEDYFGRVIQQLKGYGYDWRAAPNGLGGDVLLPSVPRGRDTSPSSSPVCEKCAAQF